jgi:hypothetical protein
MAAERAIVAGSVAQRPGSGGHTWVFLQYLLGLRRLGWDVLLLDRLEPDMCFDAQGRPADVERSVNLAYFTGVLERFGLGDSWALLVDGGERTLGRSRADVLAWAREAAVMLNVNGFITDEEVLAAARLPAYLDIDPGFGQMWRELGLHDPFAGHSAFVTIGERIGMPDCTIPTCGLDWVTTPQPVVLEEWPPVDGPGERITSVASWRGRFGPIDFRGETYGLRVHEFRRFAELPRRSAETFEVALSIDPSEVKDLQLLRENGWLLADPAEVARDPWAYREYVQRSKAELMIAKNMYVRARSGWVSDRSICYLASGRPVVAQETGFSELYPTGEGLLRFAEPEEAVEAVEAVARDHGQHSRAARVVAEEHFDSDRVIGRLLGELGVR